MSPATAWLIYEDILILEGLSFMPFFTEGAIRKKARLR